MSSKPRKTVVGMSDDYLRGSERFMEADLARSGLVPADMGCTADEINSELDKNKRVLITASYHIPFYGLDGKRLDTMYRRRRELRAGADKVVGKYVQPHHTVADGYGHFPYIPPGILSMDGDVLHLCEGEKKTACVVKYAGVRAVGLTGKDVGKSTVEVLVELVKKMGVRTVLIWPDADVQRLDVMKSYGKLRDRLVAGTRGAVTVGICKPSWDVVEYKGIDDALVGGWEFRVGEMVGEELPVDMRLLADAIGLDYSTGGKGDKFILTVNEDNLCRLLEHTDSFGNMAINLDTDKWICDGVELDPVVDCMEITRRMQRVFGVRNVTVDMMGRCIDYVCRKEKVSPWADWLRGLVWDGVGRLGGWLRVGCGAVGDREYVEEVSSKFLGGIVARSLSEKWQAVDWMLILSGPQGCGKSSVIPWLFPEEFRDLFLPAPHTQDKDLQAAAGSCRVLYFDEMATFFCNNTNQEFIKQFVTARDDVYRPPYGKASIRRQRGSVLAGSTNKHDVIRADESGYRRWAVVQVDGTVETPFGMQFDWAWLASNRDQLWAEAVALWGAGELDVSQVRRAAAIARDHVVESAEWDNYIAVLRGMCVSGKLSGGLGKGDLVMNVEFALAYKALFGDKPVQTHLNAFWGFYKCEVYRANGIRYRVLSPALVAMCKQSA